MFYALCGVELSSDKTKRIEDLCALEPLPTGDAFEDVDGRDIWHPLWKKPVDSPVNGQFISAVTDRILVNEEVGGLTYSQVLAHASCRACVRREMAGANSQMKSFRSQ